MAYGNKWERFRTIELRKILTANLEILRDEIERKKIKEAKKTAFYLQETIQRLEDHLQACDVPLLKSDKSLITEIKETAKGLYCKPTTKPQITAECKPENKPETAQIKDSITAFCDGRTLAQETPDKAQEVPCNGISNMATLAHDRESTAKNENPSWDAQETTLNDITTFDVGVTLGKFSACLQAFSERLNEGFNVGRQIYLEQSKGGKR